MFLFSHAATLLVVLGILGSVVSYRYSNHNYNSRRRSSYVPDELDMMEIREKELTKRKEHLLDYLGLSSEQYEIVPEESVRSNAVLYAADYMGRPAIHWPDDYKSTEKQNQPGDKLTNWEKPRDPTKYSSPDIKTDFNEGAFLQPFEDAMEHLNIHPSKSFDPHSMEDIHDVIFLDSYIPQYISIPDRGTRVGSPNRIPELPTSIYKGPRKKKPASMGFDFSQKIPPYSEEGIMINHSLNPHGSNFASKDHRRPQMPPTMFKHQPTIAPTVPWSFPSEMTKGMKAVSDLQDKFMKEGRWKPPLTVWPPRDKIERFKGLPTQFSPRPHQPMVKVRVQRGPNIVYGFRPDGTPMSYAQWGYYISQPASITNNNTNNKKEM